MKCILTSVFIASALIACKKDKENTESQTPDNNPTPPVITNLVCNPSFELNGYRSLNCWTLVKDFTTSPATFSNVVPINRGIFSLRLNGIKDLNWNPYAETFITNIPAQKIISLSAYIMTVYCRQPICLILDQIRGGQAIDSKSDYD
ncbi:MAG: hypothetical protein LC117_06965 [Bacteroidia bacterium]|nr:hypothetical protein [Bacteroidia bacterium]MCZ2277651.1 hypothetical protein [Bacteroidia bacterium]